MKRFFMIFAVVVLAMLVLAAPAQAKAENPQETTPADNVTLPIDLQDLLALGIGYLVTQGLKSLSNLMKRDLSGWGAALTASIVTSVVLFFNMFLSLIPETAQPIATGILALIVTVLGAFGLHATLKKFQPQVIDLEFSEFD